MNDKVLELKKIAQKLDQKALRFEKKIEKKIEKIVSNGEYKNDEELLLKVRELNAKLEEIEAEAGKAWDECHDEYYRSIGAKRPEFKEPDFPPQYYPDDEIGYTETWASETDRDCCC